MWPFIDHYGDFVENVEQFNEINRSDKRGIIESVSQDEGQSGNRYENQRENICIDSLANCLVLTCEDFHDTDFCCFECHDNADLGYFELPELEHPMNPKVVAYVCCKVRESFPDNKSECVETWNDAIRRRRLT